MQAARPASRPPVLAAAPVLLLAVVVNSGCSSFPGTTAASFLKRIEERDPNVRYRAYASLASPRCYDDDGQKAAAVKALVAKLDGDKEPTATRAVICRTLGALGRPEARDAILKAVNDDDGLVRVEACHALGKVGRQEDATILARVMTVDVLEECRIAAIEALGELKSTDSRIVVYLASAMEADDPAVRLAAHNALVATVGKDYGIKADDWKDYVRSVAGASEPDRPDAIAAAEADRKAKEAAMRPDSLEPPGGDLFAPPTTTPTLSPVYPPRPPSLPDPDTGDGPITGRRPPG